ncbi:hypothetical protein OAA39_00830 [bacterium]|nr:hypothetical protein [bacterium]
MVVKVLGLSAGGLIGAGLAAYLFSKFELNLDPKIKDVRPSVSPTKPLGAIMLVIELDVLEESEIEALNNKLNNSDGYDMKWSFGGGPQWEATHVPENPDISSVGHNISGYPRKLHVYARQAGVTQDDGPRALHSNTPSFNWTQAANRSKMPNILAGERTGFSTSLWFSFPQGSYARFLLDYQGTTYADQSGDTSLNDYMIIIHNYRISGTGRDDGFWMGFDFSKLLNLTQQDTSSTSTLGNIIL